MFGPVHQRPFPSAPLLKFKTISGNISLITNQPSIVIIYNSKFDKNYGQLINAVNEDTHNTLLKIGGTVTISHTICVLKYESVFDFQNFEVTLNGIIVIRNSSVYFASILSFDSATVYFRGMIDFSFNNCAKIITLKSQHS